MRLPVGGRRGPRSRSPSRAVHGVISMPVTSPIARCTFVSRAVGPRPARGSVSSPVPSERASASGSGRPERASASRVPRRAASGARAARAAQPLESGRPERASASRVPRRAASGARAARAAQPLESGRPERLCVLWCPDWPVVAARRRSPELGRMPVAIVERGDRGRVVLASSVEARREGVARGLRQREAEARCAGLTVIDADDGADARTFETVVRAIEQLVPQLVLERPGRLSFPTRGPSRYFGGDVALAERVLEVVRDAGVEGARVGIADGLLAAGLAAR